MPKSLIFLFSFLFVLLFSVTVFQLRNQITHLSFTFYTKIAKLRKGKVKFQNS